MKIDRSKLRKTQSDVAPECRQLIQRLRDANDVELIRILKDINTWYYGKCELQHWVDVMDKFDEILASVAKPVNGSSWILAYDKLDQLEGLEIASEKRCLVNHVLRFTALVLEHSYTRHLYNSIEQLVLCAGCRVLQRRLMLPIQVPEFAVGGHLEVVFEGIGHVGEEPTLEITNKFIFVSLLVYSNSTQDVVNPLLYQGFIEETVELLELDQTQFSDIRTAAIRTLTALVHMECSPRVNTVIDCTGLASYHGFLPTLTRNCIQALTERLSDSLPLPFATGLFSFLYHLAYYEVGAEALVSCGLLEALLRVVEHQGGDSHLTFVTRAIRIMEWIANMDLSGYQNQSGLTAIINRLEQEIKKCLPYHGAMLSPDLPSAPPIQQVGVAMETSENQGAQADSSSQAHQSEEVPMETEQPYVNSIEDSKMEVDENDAEKVVGVVEVAGPSSAANSVSKNRCLPQRAALIKAVLSFLKKSIPDPSFSESIRNVMDSSLPMSLKHIISNVEYYGPVLFMAAIDVVTVYVFHEPSLLSSLQDNGLTGVMLKALVVKEVPATREVLSSLPSVLSALCLNTRGLQAFMSCKPFDKLFRVLLSPDYLPAMRRRRTSESLGNRGFICVIFRRKCLYSYSEIRSIKRVLKLCMSIFQVRFVDSILSNNSTDDHCREFVRLGGLEPLITILGLPNLPLDFVSSPACQSVSGVCKSVLMLSHEAQVLKQGLTLLRDVLKTLEPLIARSSESPVCLLLHEVASSGRPQQAMASVQLTPLLHGIVAAHAYISMFLHVCKVGQFDIRSLCVNHWGSDQGVAVLKQLGQLYMFLIWETIVLEAISKAETAGNSETQIAAEDLEMLKASTSCQEDSQGQTHEGNSAKLPTNDKESKSALPVQQRIIKQLLQTSTSLGRALSDLFVLLVKLSVGSAQRQRRAPHPNATPGLPTLPARFIAFQLTKLLKEAFSWQGLPSACSVPKPRLHFHMCVVGLTSRMLFDDKKNPYHLMLQQFMMSGAHSNLFLLMKMILHKEVKTPASECIGQSLFDSDSQELVDSWLTLVSRLVNSDTLMDSPHALPATSTQPGFVPFKPIDFLVSTQKKAYFAVQLLWGKKLPKEYGPHLAESMLVVLYHIIKGEAVIKEKLGPTPESSGTSSSSAAARAPVETAPQPEINMQHLQQFMDMGFTHEAARLALLNTGSLEEATDYILNHPHAPPARELGLDFDMFEEDQMMRAIAMSLGQDVPAGGPATEQQASPVAAAGAAAAAAVVAASSQNTTASDSTVISANTSKVVNKEKRSAEEQTVKEADKEKDDKCPLEKSELDQFTSSMLHGCLEVLTEMPSTVFKACDVLSAVAQRNGEEWKEKTMIHILQQVTNDIQSVLKLCSTQNAENRQVEGSMSQLNAAPEAARLSSLLHLTCLLFEEKKFRCEATIEKFGILTSLLELLEVCQTILLQSKLTGGKPNTPAWLSPLLLFLDTHEKMAVTTRRKELHDKRTTHAWKWFDDRSGRWYNYNVNNNTTIDAAYRSGESGVRFMAGRRRYSVNFATMVQENEDSGNRRPIMLETASSRDGPANSRRGEPESSVASGGVVGEKRSGEDANSQPSSQDRSSKNAKKDKQDSNTSDVGKSKKEERPVIQHLNDEQKSLIVSTEFSFFVLQENEDSGNRRPIMLETASSRDGPANSRRGEPESSVASGGVVGEKRSGEDANSQPSSQDRSSKNAKKDKQDSNTSDVGKSKKEERPVIQHLNDEQKSLIVRCCTGFIGIPVSPNTLQAVLKLCLRLTQEHKLAVQFVDQGGARALLVLTQDSAVSGFTTLATLLLRHVLEDEENLKHTMEKVVRSAATSCAGGGNNTGVSPTSPGAKEINYVLRVLGPAACRNAELFKEVATNSLRLAVTPQLRRTMIEGGDSNLPSNYAQIVKAAVVAKIVKAPPVAKQVHGVICDLLNVLCASDSTTRTMDRGIFMHRSDSQMLGELGRALGQVGDMLAGQGAQQNLHVRQLPAYQRQLTGEDVDVEEMALGHADLERETFPFHLDVESNILAEHVISRHMADGRMVDDATYVIDPISSDSSDSSDDGSGGEDVGEESEDDGGDIQGDNDNETMVVTFEDSVGQGNAHDEDDDGDDDDDEDDDDEEEDEEEDLDGVAGQEGAVGLRQDGVMESSGGVDVMEEEEVEEEEEDENDEDDHDEEDDEGGSDMDEEGADIIDEDSLRIYEEEDLYLPFDEGSGRHLEWVSEPHDNRFAGTFMMTVSQDEEPETITSMAQRLSRVHGLRVTSRHHSHQSQPLHTSHHQGVSQPPLPTVVQSLLGPESTTDAPQFSSGVSHRTRHLQDEIQVIARNAEGGANDDLFFENLGESSSTNVPSALSRWAEEGQILDAHGVHYCAAAVKPEILPVLLKLQADEIAKGREEEQKKSMSMDEPVLEASASSEMVRASTPANESREPSAPPETITPPLPPRISSVVQDILSAAALEASGQNTNVGPPQLEGSNDAHVSTSEEDRTGRDAGHVENDGSPMALGDEGTGAAARSDAAQNTSIAGAPQQTTAVTSDGDSAVPSTAPDSEQPGTSGEASALTIDGIPIPDGVDPSFLEALPEAIRREVLAEQLGLHPPSSSQRIVATNDNEGATDMNVSPEFLAALPPEVQEEVLQQQRIEQERRRNQTATPEQAVDPGTFLRTLAPSLRQTVLADIDDSLLPLLPTDLASEAQTLRREIEARHHRILQERFTFSGGDRASAISALLRHSALSRHGGGSHFSRLLPSGGGLSGRVSGFSNGPPSLPPPSRKIIGRHLLDHEALACLLVLLFVEEPRLNTGRLHKVLRNLCYHEETRSWLINAMIAILRRTSGQNPDGSCPVTSIETSTRGEHSSSSQSDRTESLCRLDEYLQTQEHCASNSKASKQHSWLSFGVRTSLGSRTNVFCIKRQGKAGLERSTFVSIHPHASQFVWKHVLDALLFLAKSFPASFTPFTVAKAHPSCTKDASSSSSETKPPAMHDSTDFWDILLKLDTAGTGRKGKGAAKSSSAHSSLSSGSDSCSEEVRDFAASPIGQLLIALADPVVQDSTVVTDKLLRLLSVTSAALPDMPCASSKQAANSDTPTSAVTVPPETLAEAPVSETVTPSLNTLSSVTVTVPGDSVTTPHLTAHTPSSETESVASSLIVERSSEAGGEPHEVESLDEGSVDESSSHPSETSSQPGVVEPMVVEVTPPPDSQSQSSTADSTLLTATAATPVFKQQLDEKKAVVMEGHLRLVVDVLTSGTCSEEGLEDATTLLLQISRLNSQTRDSVLQLLLEGARRIGEALQKNIALLLNELIEHNRNLRFAEKHRTVLNQILRQSTVHLADGPFAVLVDHTRVLDFDVKRRFFRQELERLDEGIRRDDLTIHVRREHVFEDSFRELHRRSSEEMKCRLYVVFEGEEGQDAGGLLREWFMIMAREMFNPNYALFTTSPGDRVTYQPNASSNCNSNHLSYFKFVGRIVAKAIYDNKLLDCFFTRSFYKHILGKTVHFTDLESFDYAFYQGLRYLLEHDLSEIDTELTFSAEVQVFGLSEVRDLIPNGRHIAVTEENKKEYVKLVCQMKMTGAIRKQIDSFLEGFYEIIPKRLISIFDEQELELLISGLPNIDLDDLKANTEYHKYTENSLQIQWFWRALRSFDQADRAKFLQFVTGTSKVPLQGFAALEGMNGFQKFQIHRDDRSTDRLPSAHTCFNQLDLPAYETYDKLRSMLNKAVDECPEGFGLA
ncbi:PREDICTED: E3 ubiquitin-protein ligase HUWE1-like [Acropora digitifera]|uniref:E3 ubiquitin-protein ligase HUWE1-like n=1 Tax=Acropora digitifera TaxID=70779 RepID=UPI00077A9A79|nr:PREDICTED: E3 ubiquitin-protein ligase HUWE1-like [Acropora digitifera]